MNTGALHKATSSVLMTIRYAARMARLGWLRPTRRLASYVTQWSPYRGKHLHRLDCYIWGTLDYLQEGHTSQQGARHLHIAAYSDAGVAGCVETLRSTTGGQLCLEGPPCHCPMHSLFKRQDSTASSTPEAYIVAADVLVRTMLIPCLDKWGTSLQRGHKRGSEVSYAKTMQQPPR